MTESHSAVRMNNLSQEMKLHYLPSPVEGVNAAQEPTLGWPLGPNNVTISFGPSIKLSINNQTDQIALLDLSTCTDAQIIETLIYGNLTETKSRI